MMEVFDMDRIEEIRGRFIAARENICASQSGFSKWLKTHDVVVSQQNIYNFEAGLVKKVPDWLRQAAEVMNISYKWLIDGSDESLKKTSKSDKSHRRESHNNVFPLNSDDLIPMYGAVSSASPEIVRFSEDYMIEEVPRHPSVQRVKGAFAMLVQSDTMAPRHMPGERVYIHPYLVPSIGQDCVIVQEPDGDAALKQFRGETATEWMFIQLNPTKELIIKKSKVRNIYAVVR